MPAALNSERLSLSLTRLLARKWFLLFLILYGLWVWMPFFAPLFMHLGWESAAKGLYIFYSFFCHQLPQRSFFLFGSQIGYSLEEIQAAWLNTINPLLLRQFSGTPEMGWKVAWSDRMIAFYGSIWLFAFLWYTLRRRIKGLTFWGMVLFLLPMLVDGSTHFISDLAGIGQGFRDQNLWLAQLTNYAFPLDFYRGDAPGSFNSWMRLISGVLSGAGTVWFAFPYLEKTFLPEEGGLE